MELSGDYVFDAPQELVWRALLDPNVLGAVMPGSKGFEQKGENQYAGMLEVKVGPVQGTFQGQITLSNIVTPESYHIEVDGKGALGFVKATGQLYLKAQSGQTAMEYSGKAQVGGRIASVGQRLMDSAARSIIRQSLEALNEYLKIEVAKQPSPAVATADAHDPAAAPVMAQSMPTAEYKPPSQTALAMNVARDVFNDIVPRKYQPWLFGAAIVIVVLIIVLVASR
jgi:carbon monoxide dehydrogenase subunit G